MKFQPLLQWNPETNMCLEKFIFFYLTRSNLHKTPVSYDFFYLCAERWTPRWPPHMAKRSRKVLIGLSRSFRQASTGTRRPLYCNPGTSFELSISCFRPSFPFVRNKLENLASGRCFSLFLQRNPETHTDTFSFLAPNAT